jgi:alkanesulfonate monooxygenase SsuD/methylene tetrahydromethanopterin reductase-like flavin-dependent oxidoreductase (luciferase family)
MLSIRGRSGAVHAVPLSEDVSMRVGVTMYIQNYSDWDRFNALERGEDVPPLEPNTDAVIWDEEIDAALQVEELGFDSLWVVEHHASPYTMITDPIQALAFFAGATARIDVGTMIVVLPWHNPLRVAEEMTMLQHMLRGRDAYIGVGRGLGRREFRALGVDMNNSAEMFAEAVEVIRLALSEEKFSYRGRHYRYDDVTMRPRPRDAQRLLDTMCFSWGSPTSAPAGARHGLRPLIIPQKSFDEYHADLEAFAVARAEAGYEPARPRIHLSVYCHEDSEKAEAAARTYVPEYIDSAARNYELHSDHFGSLRGYEHYRKVSTVSFDQLAQAAIGNAIWGTPQMCLDKIKRLCDAFHPEEFMLVGRFGSMSRPVSEASMALFAREVLPAVQALPLEEPIGYRTNATLPAPR